MTADLSDYQEALAAADERIDFLEAVIRVAEQRLRVGGTFPINGETWSMLASALAPSEASDACGRCGVTNTHHKTYGCPLATDQALRPEVAENGWKQVAGYEEALLHCESRDAVRIGLANGSFEGVFAYHGGKFYAFKLPSLPQREGKS